MVGSVGRPDHENVLTAFCERLTAFCGRVYRDAVCWSGLQIGADPDDQQRSADGLSFAAAAAAVIRGQFTDHINKDNVTAFLDALTAFCDADRRGVVLLVVCWWIVGQNER